MAICKSFFAGLLALCCLSLTALSPNSAQADSMTWKLRSFDKNAVDVTFYSRNRKAVWPGNGQVYVMRDYEVKTFKLSCISGEQICYGAWQRGNAKKYWGVGQGGKAGCKSCCYTCKDGAVTNVFNLNE